MSTLNGGIFQANQYLNRTFKSKQLHETMCKISDLLQFLTWQCRMATSKHKRLMNSTNSEQCRPLKKTKFDSSNCLVSLKPHIGLKWDQYLKRVVPIKEQVGILWSDLAPFIESKKQLSGLADVTYVPSQFFSLENLRDVLSYKVCLAFLLYIIFTLFLWWFH
jgi:hypothetical protein